MQSLRITNLNCEWMNDWFTRDSEAVDFVPSFTRDNHVSDTHEVAGRLSSLILEINPDILAIEEAPSRPAELELFINTYLSENGSPRYHYLLSDSGRSQKIGLLFKPEIVSAHLTSHSSIGDLIDSWQADVDGNEQLEGYEFTRLPLVVDAMIGTEKVQIITLHTKSNFINNGKSMWEEPATRQQFVHLALQNRRRNSAEAMRTRAYIDRVLQDDPTANIIVMGDLNDGPGMDYFERNYLSHNVTDILIGSAYEPEGIFMHAQHDIKGRDERFTAVFDDFVTGELGKKLLLDHMLVSPGLWHGNGLAYVPGSGTIHHAEYEANVENGGGFREERPSDHRPVSLQIAVAN